MLVVLIFGTGLPFTRPNFYLSDDLEKQSTTNVSTDDNICVLFVTRFSFTQEDRIQVQYLVPDCFTTFSYIWLGFVMFFFYTIQHGYAIFVALKIRKVKIEVLNEFKEVSLTIYISTLVITEGFAIAIILRGYETIVESLVSTAIIIVATTYVGFTFIPKVCFYLHA